MKSLLKLSLAIFSLFIWSCSSNPNKIDDASDLASVKKIVNDWNEAHNNKDIGLLSNLYDNSVKYYGRNREKNDCVDNKLSEFKKHKDYYQLIDGEIKCDKNNDSTYKCSFIKKVTINHKTKDYPSYLILNKVADSWKITEESDIITDRNLSKDEKNSSDVEYSSETSTPEQRSNPDILKIGPQYWMSYNLNVSRFSNGDEIQQAYTLDDWFYFGSQGTPAWCYYDFNPSNGNKYGKLYNWYAVNDNRGLAPRGWHIPSDTEWDVLVRNSGGDSEAGYVLKSESGWYNDGNGNNRSGFCGLPGGSLHADGRFSSLGKGSSWWTSSSKDYSNAYSRHLHYKDDAMHIANYELTNGLSIRCVKN